MSKNDHGEQPLDGAISKFFENEAPADVRDAIMHGGKRDILTDGYPYDRAMDKGEYEEELHALQIELACMQAWVKESGARIAIVFEGRDAAGKGGCIKRFSQYLNPRGSRVVALSKPSETERRQWYFQRYIAHLPSAGEFVFFDRSWYNRAVVERVFGFSDDQQRERFFRQAPEFEHMLVESGIHLFKFWLTVGRAEQLRRFLARESDPLKHWKLSPIDVESLNKWDDYTEAITEMFQRTHRPLTPWSVVQADCKKRMRLATLRKVLSEVEYDGKRHDVVGAPDPQILGSPDVMPLADA